MGRCVARVERPCPSHRFPRGCRRPPIFSVSWSHLYFVQELQRVQRSKGGAEVIPRTDQFIEISDTEVAIVGVATWQDQVWHLKDRLRVFLGVVGTLERDEDRNYLATDPRAGKLASVHTKWMRMVGAAQLLLATSVVRLKISPETNGIVRCFGTSSESSRAVTDVARSICFLLSEEETRGVIPAEKIERLRAIAGHLEDLTMSDEVGRLRAVQEEFQRWVQGTPGVRAWIKGEVLPPVLEMVNEQERLIASKRAAVNGLEEERRCAWHEGRSLEVPDEVKAMYDRDSDPRQLSARRIGRLRDEGKHEKAQIAEAFAVLSFHDAGEAGNIDKLMPLLTEIRGLSSQFDLAYFARCDSGLERKDWEPRFDAQVMRGMVERFKARFERGGKAEYTTGYTNTQIREAAGMKSQNTLKALLRAKGIVGAASGDSQHRFGASTIWTLIEHCESHRDTRIRRYATGLRDLLGVPET